jgi:hypothetical protein
MKRQDPVSSIWIQALGMALVLTLALAGGCQHEPDTSPVHQASLRTSSESIRTDLFMDWLVQHPEDDPRWPYGKVDFGAAGINQWDPATLDTFPDDPSRNWTVLTLENPWLQVDILPGLGGRIWRIVNRSTGANQLFENPAGIKLNPWGRLGWWLAAGGIELMAPQDEHGGPFYLPWTWESRRRPDGLEVVLAFDEQEYFNLAYPRWAYRMTIFLPDDSAFLELEIEIINDSAENRDLMAWTNALVAPGGRGMRHVPGTVQYQRYGLDQRVFLGNHTVRTANHNDNGARTFWDADGDGLNNWDVIPWPLKSGTPGSGGNPVEVDISLLRNWYALDLGFAGLFAGRAFNPGDNDHEALGQYDLATDQGICKLVPAEIVPGVVAGLKYWHWGSHAGAGWGLAALFSDGRASYAELMAGPAPAFAEESSDPVVLAAREALRDTEGRSLAASVPVPPGEAISWTERYYSPSGLGDLQAAFPGGALSFGPAVLLPDPDRSLSLPLAVWPVKAGKLDLTVALTGPDGSELPLATLSRQVGPGRDPGPFQETLNLPLPSLDAAFEANLAATLAAGEAHLVITLDFPDGTRAQQTVKIDQ